MQSQDSLPSETAYLVWSGNLSHLEGQLLTLIEAVTTDPEQRRAIKNLVSPMLWSWASSQCARLKSEGLDSPNFKVVNPIQGSN